MTEDNERLRDRMLAAYGASLSGWPKGRMDGLIGILTSAEFRRARRDAKALDQAIEGAAVPLRDGAKLERRLLAAMGVAEAPPRTLLPAGLPLSIKAAAAIGCLCLGVALAGLFSDGVLDDGVYAVIVDEDWTEIETENFMLLEDSG